MDEDFLNIMWHEYCARDGFCVQLRVDLEWDKDAFNRLTEAMRRCCKFYEILSAQQQKQQYEQARQSPQEHVAKQNEPEEDAEEELFHPPLPEAKRLLPDWLAELFWDLSHFVRDWTSHDAWNGDRTREPVYFEKAYERLDSLASWFFTGNCPWLDEEKGWASTSVV